MFRVGFSGRLPGKPTLFFKLSRQEIGCLFRACRIFMTRLLRKRGEKRQKNVVSRQGAGPRPEKREKPESLAAQERRGGGSRVPTLFFRKRAILVERLLRIKETEKDVGKVEESLIRKIEQDKSRKKTCFRSVKTGRFTESMMSDTGYLQAVHVCYALCRMEI